MPKSKDKSYEMPRPRDEAGAYRTPPRGPRPEDPDNSLYGARGPGGNPAWDRSAQSEGVGGAYDGGYGEGGLGEAGMGQRGGYAGGQRRYGPGGFAGAYGAGGPEHGRGSGMGQGGMGERGSQDAPRGQGWGGRAPELGERDYGYRSGQRDEGQSDRGFLERAGDEVSSWFGDEDARQRREADHRGKGPRGYRRSDDRIREDVNDRLLDDPAVDASDIEVTVENGEVTLSGEVSSRQEKRGAEDCVERVSGVGHVQNNLRIRAAATPGQSGQTGRPGGTAL